MNALLFLALLVVVILLLILLPPSSQQAQIGLREEDPIYARRMTLLTLLATIFLIITGLTLLYQIVVVN